MKECIIVPTRGRHEVLAKRKTHTLKYVQHYTGDKYIAVRRSEVDDYADMAQVYDVGFIIVPDHINTIAKTYDFIFSNTSIVNSYDYILMLDDDLIFSERPSYSSPSFVKLPEDKFPQVVEEMFLIFSQLY